MNANLTEPSVERESLSARLLATSAKLSFDPNTAIDWNAEFDDDKFFVPEKRCSLYGTSIWESMSRAERIELSKHELANGLMIGIWGELVLAQMLLRHLYDEDYTANHFRYGLTEIGDECRHSAMFSRMIAKIGGPRYALDPFATVTGRLMKSTSGDATAFIAAIWLEEATDALQREAMADDDVQPLVREMFRIHVIEEARHIRYGNDEGARQWAKLAEGRVGAVGRISSRIAIGAAAGVYLSRWVRPKVYESVGLDPLRATFAALMNRNTWRTAAWMTQKAVKYSTEIGVAPESATRLVGAFA